MNILFVSSWYPTNENPNFGIFIKEHAKAIHSTENKIVVLAIVVQRSTSFFKIHLNDYIDEWGIHTIEIILSSRFRDIVYHLIPLQNKIAYFYFKKLISSSFNPDIIHSNVVFPAGMIGDFISRKIHKPHVITEHWSKIAGILQKTYLRSLTEKTYQNASRIFPVSEFLKNNIIHLMPALDVTKFSVIANVIDSNLFTYHEKQHSNEEIRFCAIASWATKKIPDKKPELFIEALSQIQQNTTKKIILTMIGGGDRVDELKLFCEKQPYKTEFLGYQLKEQIAKTLQNSDYFVHASTIETFGVVIAEALMTGTPVICSNVGALPELIDDTNGILCENTVEKWVEGIEKAINKQFNHSLISQNLENRFSSKTIGDKFQGIYSGLL